MDTFKVTIICKSASKINMTSDSIKELFLEIQEKFFDQNINIMFPSINVIQIGNAISDTLDTTGGLIQQ